MAHVSALESTPEPTPNLPQEITAGPASAPYNHLRMQLSSDVRIENGMLAAIALRNEKPRQGVPSKNPALHLGIDACNSTLMLGLQSTAALNRIGSRSTGKERDTESGNDYMFARYYNSATGRFLSPDWSVKVAPVPYAKLDNPQSLNLYSYVWNNPLSRNDPDGHEVDLTGDKKDKDAELKRLSANASKKDKNGLRESSLFKETTDKDGKTTMTLDKDAAANFKGEHSAGYNLLTGAINAKPTITVGMSNMDSYTGRLDAQGNTTVNLNRNESPTDINMPLRGLDGQRIPNPFSIIAGHEVLGHAYPRIMGWPSDEGSARQTENQLRQDQGLPLRDPNSN
jgi:RHS repeat-associated protein